MKEKEFRTQYIKTKAPRLDFDHSFSQIYSQSNKEVISNLKTQRSRPEKATIRKYWLKDVLWKAPSSIHYFSWILCFPLGVFLCS